METNQIILELNIFTGEYPHDVLEAAVSRKDEITPLLLEILEDVLMDPDKYIENHDDYHAYFYGFYLLTLFREPKAHPLFIKIFSLPEEIIENLYGDAISESLGIGLLQTCNGDFTQIKSMILDDEVYEYCRSAAIDALVYGVHEQLISRQEVVEFMAEILKTGIQQQDYDFVYASAALALDDLYPKEFMDLIKQALDEGVIDSFTVNLNHFQNTINKGEEACQQKLAEEYNNRKITDIHNTLSNWAMFNEEDDENSTEQNEIYEALIEKLIKERPEQPVDFLDNFNNDYFSGAQHSHSATKTIDKKKKKSRQKAQKKSRKKNRRKK